MDGPGRPGGLPEDDDVRRIVDQLTKRRPDLDPWVGRVLGERWLVDSHLTDGGMARIYAGRHIRLDRPVAIKMLDVGEASAAQIERFRRESMSASRLRSAHVAQVFDCDQLDDGVIYFVMELLDGATLGELLAESGIPPLQHSVAILRQLAFALDEAHRCGIVHRDLKPENVFLCRDAAYDPFVKVLDFGIAKELLRPGESLTRVGAILGTPGYMPPEQIRADERDSVTPASDIYSLGAIALELLTGELPVAPAQPVRMMEAVVERPPRLPSELGLSVAGLDEVLARALSKRASERPPSATALVDDLARVLAADTSLARACDAPRTSAVRDLVKASMPPARHTETTGRHSVPQLVETLAEDDSKLEARSGRWLRWALIAAALAAAFAAGWALG